MDIPHRNGGNSGVTASPSGENRLRSRLPELRDSILTRLRAIDNPDEVHDPVYAAGLREALLAALDYGFEAVERPDATPSPVPPRLRVQACLAARNGVGLDTVLRRYLAGYALFTDFLLEELAQSPPSEAARLRRGLRAIVPLFDRLIEAVTEEHRREAGQVRSSGERRRAARIEALLGGAASDPSAFASEFGYQLADHHLGLVAVGPAAREALVELAAVLDRRLLVLPRAEDVVWAWLGGRRRFDREYFEAHLASNWPTGSRLALGEPAQGLSGWRLSHHQASAAFAVATLRSARITHYADVALLASSLRNDLLATSLHQLYLVPLETERDGGRAALEMLEAYFAAERNVSSAAARLGIHRNTAASRLRSIEHRLGRPLGDCALELEVALQLRELGNCRE